MVVKTPRNPRRHHDCLRKPEHRRIPRSLQDPIRPLHRWAVGGSDQGAVFRKHHARHRQGLLRGRPRHRRGHRGGNRRSGGSGGPVGQDQPGRPRGDPEQDRRPHRGKPGNARRRRNLGQRQGGARNHQRRPPVGRRPLPLLRRLHPRPGGRPFAARRQHHLLPLPRAARRGRPDHPVELPNPHGRLEARPGPRRGQRHRPEAGRADPGLHPGT